MSDYTEYDSKLDYSGGAGGRGDIVIICNKKDELEHPNGDCHSFGKPIVILNENN